MQSSFSYFVRFETVHNVEESWGFVSLDFIVRHNDKVLHIVILSSIEGKIVEMSVSPFKEISFKDCHSSRGDISPSCENYYISYTILVLSTMHVLHKKEA